MTAVEDARMTPFRCPRCKATSFEQITPDRPGRRPVYACCGCSIIFLNPERFTLAGAPAEPKRPPGWIDPP